MTAVTKMMTGEVTEGVSSTVGTNHTMINRAMTKKRIGTGINIMREATTTTLTDTINQEVITIRKGSRRDRGDEIIVRQFFSKILLSKLTNLYNSVPKHRNWTSKNRPCSVQLTITTHCPSIELHYLNRFLFECEPVCDGPRISLRLFY